MRTRRISILGQNRTVFYAGVVSFFMDVSSEMIYPLVPLFLASVLGAPKSVIGLIEGIAESTASLLKAVSGRLSDRLGRRMWLMLAGYGISTLSRPLIAVSGQWSQVLTARFVDRFGKGIRTAPRDALIAESSEPLQYGRAFGFHRAMDTLGAILGPAAASLILACWSGNYRLVFWLSLIPAILAVLTIALFIRDPRPQRLERLTKPTFSWRCLSSQYRYFVLVATLFALGNSSDAFLLLRAQQVGVQVAAVPLVYILFNAVYAAAALPAGILSDRIGPRQVILASFMLFGLVYFGFARAGRPEHIWILFPLYGIFMALHEAVNKAFLATMIPSDLKATGFGLYNAMIGLAALPGSIVGGLLWDRFGPSATFMYGSATACLAAVLFLGFYFFFSDAGSRIAAR